MTNTNGILHLTDFIDYDLEREKFIIHAHTIEIDNMEISFDDMTRIDDTRRWKLKSIMQKIGTANGYSFSQMKWYRWVGMGNTNGSNLKKSIEDFLMRHTNIPNHFDFISIQNKKIVLKPRD